MGGHYTRFDLAVEAIDGEPAEGGIRVTMAAPLQPIQRGERLRLRGEIEPPAELEEFDYAAYLRSRDIHVVLGFPREWERLGEGDRDWQTQLLRFRRWGIGNIERALPDPAATLAAGVLVGEQRAMSPQTVEDLRVTGTTHLVVVSGQNVALLLGIAVAALTAIVPRRRAALITLALLPPYLVLVGMDPPVVRGSLMACSVVIASLAGRRTPGWIYLIYAVAVMLAVDPALIDDVAFQLSAAATAGVMLIAPVLRDWTLARLHWGEDAPGRAAFIEVAATATGASLAVVPVQAAAFGYVSLWSVPANILVAPLYEGSVLIAAIAALTGWWTPAAEVIGLGGRAVPEAFLAIVSIMAQLPNAAFPVDAPLPAGVAFYAVLLAGTWWLARHTGPPAALDQSRRSGLEWTVMFGLVAGILWLAVLTPTDDLASVTILDVGQGSAALIRDGDTQVLVDTGPPDGVVLAALHRTGARRGLDAVILSHADTDHAGGLHPLLRRADVHALYATDEALETLEFTQGAEGAALTIGDRVHISDRVTLEILAPPSHTRDRRHASPNEASLVVMVTIGERRILLPGDIEAGSEDWLVRSGQRLHADVIAVPHHGSRTSSSPEFVDAVGAAVAVASVGLDNRFGHPHEEVVERYEDALFLRTDLNGDITIRSDGTRLWVSTSR